VHWKVRTASLRLRVVSCASARAGLVRASAIRLGFRNAAESSERAFRAAVTVSQTLGTALGDWIADTGGLGYEGGALVFAVGLLVLAALYYWTNVSRAFLFWAAFILTRPLGATVGDFLDKPVDHGGIALSCPLAFAAIALFIVLCVALLPQRG